MKIIQKVLVSAMIVFIPLLLFIIFLAYFLGRDDRGNMEKIIVFAFILPGLLLIVLGFTFFAKKYKSVQRNFVANNIDILKGLLGDAVVYHPEGKIPFHIVGEDPSLSAKFSNSCRCNHMLKGTYKNVEFIASNMETRHSRGYGEIDDTVFEGFYILLNGKNHVHEPIYVCQRNFWNEFNHRGSLHFTVNDTNIYEWENEEFSLPYKIVSLSEQTHHHFINDDRKKKLNHIFQDNPFLASIYYYPDGKIGMAVRHYNAFHFSEFKIFNIGEKELSNIEIRDKINKDTLKIREMIEQLLSIGQN